MQIPDNTPKLFHDALLDFLNTLDVSIDRIAPFAGLHPEQLRRLGKDGKHRTLAPNAINRLIDAPNLVGRTLTAELQEAWSRRLKVSSLYTVLVAAAHRRTHSAWPQTPEDYKFVWDRASDLVVYSGYTLYLGRDESYKNRDIRGFPGDSVALWSRWSKNQAESEEQIAAALDEIDKT